MPGDHRSGAFRCLSKKVSVKGNAAAMNRPVGYAIPVTERDASPLDEDRGRGVSEVSKQVLDGALHWEDVTHAMDRGVSLGV